MENMQSRFSAPIPSRPYVRLIKVRNLVALDERYCRSVRFADIMLFTRSGDVMSALNHRLHPAKTRIAGRADLLRTEFCSGNFQITIATFVQQKLTVSITCANNFTLVRLI